MSWFFLTKIPRNSTNCCHSRSNMTTTKPWEKNIRLPLHLVPLHYDLWLYPHLEKETFEGCSQFFFLMLKIFVSGNVRIDITATAPADYFLVHTKKLHILTTVLEKDGSELPLSSHFEFTKHQFWVVIPESQAGPGNYSLKFKFIRVCIKTPRVKVFPLQHLILNQLMRGKELGRKNWILDLIIGKLSLVLMNLPSNPHSALNWWDPARVILLSLTCQWNRRLSIPPHQVGIIDWLFPQSVMVIGRVSQSCPN